MLAPRAAALGFRWVGGAGLRPGGPRAWPEGISEAYCRTLSTEMRRVGARFRTTFWPLLFGRWDGVRAAWGRSLESVTCNQVSITFRTFSSKAIPAGKCITRTDGPLLPATVDIVNYDTIESIKSAVSIEGSRCNDGSEVKCRCCCRCSYRCRCRPEIKATAPLTLRHCAAVRRLARCCCA